MLLRFQARCGRRLASFQFAEPHFWDDSLLVGALPGVPASPRSALDGRVSLESLLAVSTFGSALDPGIGSLSRLPA